jgi:hypothetical protein
MSGGYWNYENDYLASEIYNLSPNYGSRGRELSVEARRRNPFDDKQISELIWDVFCLMHCYDWYRSSDICEEGYREDVKWFKDKWFTKTGQELIKREIDLSLAEMKEDLYKTLGVGSNEETNEA